MESGALTDDSKGTNDLSNVGVTEDTVTFMEGLCSGAYTGGVANKLYIANADLDSGFPLKNGESNKTFSIAVWFKCTGDIADYANLVYTPSVDDKSFLIWLCSSKINFYLSSYGSDWDYETQHATALVADRWYHVVVTYDSSDDSVRIRIWDDTAQAIVGVDKTDTLGDVHIGDAPFCIGSPSSGTALGGNIDEVVVFDRVLSIADIDSIRAGTYGAAPPEHTVLDYERKTRGVARGVIRGAA